MIIIYFKQGTQKQILYDYLQTGKTITTRSAIIDLGIADLQSVIRDLKKAGVSIHSHYISVPNRYGKQATVKEYSLDVFGYKTAEDFAVWNQ